MNLQDISLEIRTASIVVVKELGYDTFNGSQIENLIHPMLRENAYIAGKNLFKKVFIKPRLFIDRKSFDEKEQEASEWLKNITFSRFEGEAIKKKLISKEAIQMLEMSVYAEYENGD